MIVTRIRPLTLARVTGVVYAAIGLFIGAIFAIASFFGTVVGAMAHTHFDGEPWMGAFVGVLVLVGAPIFYGILGFLGGLFTAAVYNLAARVFGGVELEVLER
ncbi:MAG TPA: hypothetical protein VIE68_03590 [Gemmatimonadota bacterium]|jgi:hypothetical protein